MASAVRYALEIRRYRGTWLKIFIFGPVQVILPVLPLSLSLGGRGKQLVYTPFSAYIALGGLTWMWFYNVVWDSYLLIRTEKIRKTMLSIYLSPYTPLAWAGGATCVITCIHFLAASLTFVLLAFLFHIHTYFSPLYVLSVAGGFVIIWSSSLVMAAIALRFRDVLQIMVVLTDTLFSFSGATYQINQISTTFRWLLYLFPIFVTVASLERLSMTSHYGFDVALYGWLLFFAFGLPIGSVLWYRFLDRRSRVHAQISKY